jgi:hypothetical protein
VKLVISLEKLARNLHIDSVNDAYAASQKDPPPMAIRGVGDREVLTVARDEGRWAVEYRGAFSDHTSEKEEAKAAANKRARVLQDEGRACQVRVSGEHGFFGEP